VMATRQMTNPALRFTCGCIGITESHSCEEHCIVLYTGRVLRSNDLKNTYRHEALSRKTILIRVLSQRTRAQQSVTICKRMAAGNWKALYYTLAPGNFYSRSMRCAKRDGWLSVTTTRFRKRGTSAWTKPGGNTFIVVIRHDICSGGRVYVAALLAGRSINSQASFNYHSSLLFKYYRLNLFI